MKLHVAGSNCAHSGTLFSMGCRGPAIATASVSVFTIRKAETAHTSGTFSPRVRKQPRPDIVPALVRVLGDTDNQVRSRAIQVLGEIGSLARPAVPALGRLIHDKDESIRGASVDALGKCCADFDETLPYLIDAVSDPVLEVRKVAVFHLGKMGPKAKTSVPALIPVLSDKEIFLRAWTAEALGNMGPDAKAALPRLHQMQFDNVPSNEADNLRDNVQEAIKKIGP